MQCSYEPHTCILMTGTEPQSDPPLSVLSWQSVEALVPDPSYYIRRMVSGNVSNAVALPNNSIVKAGTTKYTQGCVPCNDPRGLHCPDCPMPKGVAACFRTQFHVRRAAPALVSAGMTPAQYSLSYPILPILDKPNKPVYNVTLCV